VAKASAAVSGPPAGLAGAPGQEPAADHFFQQCGAAADRGPAGVRVAPELFGHEVHAQAAGGCRIGEGGRIGR